MEGVDTNQNRNDVDYGFWAVITGVLAFIAIWIYAIIQWGLLLGLMFGWLPALIGGFVLGLLWPLVVLVLLWLWFFK